MNRAPSALVFVAILSCGLPGRADTLPPVVNIGLFVSPEFVSDPDGAMDNSWHFGLNAGLGWRISVSDGGFISIVSDVTGIIFGGATVQDQEFLRGKAAFPLGTNRIEPEISLTSSVLGFYGSDPFLNPQWNLGYRIFTDDENSSLVFIYVGYLVFLPETADDVFQEGIKAVLSLDPSIRWALDIEVGWGWEDWYETNVYQSNGSAEGQNRQDWIVDGSITMDGLIGYVTEWTWETRFAWRSSNANLYLGPDLFLPDTESRINLSMESGLDWSPIRTLGLHVSAYVDRAWYLERNAFDSQDLLTEELLSILDLGGNLRVDWNRFHRWYLFLEASGGFTFSNDPDQAGWRFQLFTGVEISLP